MNRAIIITGSNRGNRVQKIQKAAALINQFCGQVIQAGVIYQSEPWGFEDEISFLNQVLIINTKLQPIELLQTVLQIESAMGRTRAGKGYTGRIIDIDILFYDDLIINLDHLVLPHPRISVRRFVLVPLNDLVPDLVHPSFNKTIRELLANCTDNSQVFPYKSMKL